MGTEEDSFQMDQVVRGLSEDFSIIALSRLTPLQHRADLCASILMTALVNTLSLSIGSTILTIIKPGISDKEVTGVVRTVRKKIMKEVYNSITPYLVDGQRLILIESDEDLGDDGPVVPT